MLVRADHPAGSRLITVRVFWGTVIGCAVLAATVGGSAATSHVASPAPTSSSGEPSAPPGAAAAVVVSVTDGDTVGTSAGTVRIIGIDAPERGECGYDDASSYVSGLLPEGDTVTLTLPDGENEEDKYGRLLRYVDTTQGVDVASSLLAAGVVVARYDSTDGVSMAPSGSGLPHRANGRPSRRQNSDDRRVQSGLRRSRTSETGRGAASRSESRQPAARRR